jgi:hypothetical protein
MMFAASLIIGLPQRLSELVRNSFNAFSVILGLNCSALGSISRAKSCQPNRKPTALASSP